MSGMFDTVIEGADVVTADGIRRMDVAIDGEHIAALLHPGSRPTARRRVDASGLHLLPGLSIPTSTCAIPPDPTGRPSRAERQPPPRAA